MRMMPASRILVKAEIIHIGHTAHTQKVLAMIITTSAKEDGC